MGAYCVICDVKEEEGLMVIGHYFLSKSCQKFKFPKLGFEMVF